MPAAAVAAAASCFWAWKARLSTFERCHLLLLLLVSEWRFRFRCFCCLLFALGIAALRLTPAAVAVEEPATPFALGRFRFVPALPPPTALASLAPEAATLLRASFLEGRFIDNIFDAKGVAAPLLLLPTETISDRGRLLPLPPCLVFFFLLEVGPLLSAAAAGVAAAPVVTAVIPPVSSISQFFVTLA